MVHLASAKPTLTTEALVHGLFLQVDSIQRQGLRLRIRCHPTSDPDVASVTFNVSRDRAKELGLLH